MTCTPRPADAPRYVGFRSRAQRRGWRRMDAALRRASAYPHPAGRVVRVETHISVVYLAGRYAYKIKKPADFGFADFSTRAARLRCCLRESRLNRPLGASIYVGVVPVVLRGRAFRIGADGEPIDYAVKLVRFRERDVLSAALAHNELQEVDVNCIADRLAAFHCAAPHVPPRRAFGSAALIRGQLDALLTALDRAAPACVPDAVRVWCTTEAARLAAHFDARRAGGFVRACHGDLHLGNMVRRGRDVLMFDCIEFDDALRWIDVTSDLAFALMDLTARGRADQAARLLNRWLAHTGDYGGLPALRFYVVYRALVRVLAAVSKRGGDAEAQRYLRCAEDGCAPPSVFLMLCHGFSGAGKSIASTALAPRLGALRLSSDVERKRARPLTPPSARPLPPSAYTGAARDAHYAHLRMLTGIVLQAGYPAVVDASFLQRAQRQRFIELARNRALPLLILDFHADPAQLAARVGARARRPAEPSDADAGVLARQLAAAEPFADEEMPFVLSVDAGAPAADLARPALLRALRGA